MKYDFGDIDLFNLAIASSRVNPPVEEYLRSVGLSEAESTEVCALFRVFCQAIENAPDAQLPEIASASNVRTVANVTLTGRGN